MIQSETLKIGNPLRVYMEYRGWRLIKTHGNQFQQGLPDYYCIHHKYSPKWVETKIHGRPLTEAQKKLFPVMLSCNVPIWIIDGEDFRGEKGKAALHSAYNLLFQPPNAALYILNKKIRGGLW